MKNIIISCIVAVVGVLLLLVEFKRFDKVGFKAESSQSQQTKLKVNANYGRIPMHFEPNQGQAADQVEFLSRGAGYSLFLTKNEAVLSLRKPEIGERVPGNAELQDDDSSQNSKLETELKMKLAGANPDPQVAGVGEFPGKSNYLIGNDPKQWRTNVPNYSKVKYQGVYPGIDLVYYGNQRQLEYDFVVAPGADPNVITLGFQGADDISIDEDGNLVLIAKGGEVMMHAPVIYQETQAGKQSVSGNFEFRGKDHIGFEVDAYDASRPLVIDPVLVYSTYLGGSHADFGLGIAVDTEGNAYVTGNTRSTDFPTENAFQDTLSLNFGSATVDVFVAKLNPQGTALIYSTYIGGRGDDAGNGIAVDAAGNAYVTGETSSRDDTDTPDNEAFPTVNAFQDETCFCKSDAFLLKLNAAGNMLLYSSYFGGLGDEMGIGIDVDPNGKAYIIGDLLTSIGQPPFPLRNNFPSDFSAESNPFMAVFDPSQSGDASLIYSTIISGSVDTRPGGIAVDAAGNAYLTGATRASNFPTKNPLQPAINGSRDAFVAKIDPAQVGDASLIYSTYLGGSDQDSGDDIAVDAGGNAYVTGFASSGFQTTAGAFKTAGGGPFVAKLTPDGSAFVYSTLLLPVPGGVAIALDVDGNAYVTGGAISVAKLNPAGSDTVFTTSFGGSGINSVRDIAADDKGNVYVTGHTRSTDFPIRPTANPLQDTPKGLDEAFVTKIGEAMDFELFFDGVAVDPGNFVPGAFPLQNQYTGLGVRGSGLGNITEVLFAPDDQLVVSNVQASANEVSFDLAVWDKVQLGERDLILKKSDGQQISVTDMIGKKFIITQAFFEFNQAVADRELPTEEHRLIQIAGKPGVMRVQFEDDAQVGRTFAGTLFVTGFSEGNSVVTHEVKNGYTSAEVRTGADYLTIPYPSPDPNVSRSLPEGEHEFTCLLVSDDLLILGPDLKRQFVESEALDIVIYDALLETVRGFPPFQHRLTDAEIDEAISFVKSVYPVSESRLKVARRKALIPANATIENARGERINVEVIARSRDTDGNLITHITSERDDSRNGELYLFATLKALLNDLNAQGNSHNVIVLLLPEDMLVKNLGNGIVEPGSVGTTNTPLQVILVSEDAADLGATIAHEIGHLVVTALRKTSLRAPGGAGDLGDEYECGFLECRVNFPVQDVQDVTSCDSDEINLRCVLSPLVSGIHGDNTGTFASRSGFDPVRLLPKFTLLDVDTVWNFMSTGVPGVEPDPIWVSSLVYNELMKDFVPGAVNGNASAQKIAFSVGEIIDITGTIRDDDIADFDNFAVSTVGHTTPDSGGTYRLELQNSGGSVLASHNFEVQFVELSEPPAITDRVSFGARMELVAGSRRVVLKKNGIELASRALSDNPPTVQITSPQAGATLSGVVELNWIGSDPDGDRLSYSILLTDGNGEITPVASLLPDPAFIFDTSLFPPVTSASIRVIANDGFNRGSDVVDNITLAASTTLSPPFNLTASASGDTVTLNWDAPTPLGTNANKQNAISAQNHLSENRPPTHIGVKGPKRQLARSSSKSGTKRRTLVKWQASQIPEQLSNGVPVTRSVAEGGIQEFFITVPADADSLVFLTSNSSGDPDLFVQFTSAPDIDGGSFDFFSDNSSPLEDTVVVTIGTNPPLIAGDWFVTVEGFEASTFTLTAIHNGENASGLLSFNIYRSETSNARVTGTLISNVNANTTSFSDIVPNHSNLFYQVTAVYDRGESIPSNEASLLVTNVESTPGNIPEGFALSQNFPNPFNPETRIQYDLPKSTQVKIEIFNLLGQKVRTLLNEQRPAGTHTIVWDGKLASGEVAPSGVYIYRLKTGEFEESKKLLLLR